MDGDPVGSSVESMMAEQQQLSPVSVLDFPFQDDDDDDGVDERSYAGACSPCSFQPCQPDLQRSDSAREPPLQHKIRRLDGRLAQQAGVDPVDLDPRFAASDESGESDDTQAQSSSSVTDDSAATTTSSSSTPRPTDEEQQRQSTDDAEREPRHAHHQRLLARLLDDENNKAVVSVATERLLLDFFVEGLDRRRSVKAGPVLGTVKAPDHDRDEAALVHAAKRWVEGLGTQWGVEDVLFAGEAALADMDRERRWMCLGVEEREVGVAEGLLMDALVAELVSDLAVRC